MSVYAIVETGSKQYRVEPQSIIEIERLEVPENEKQITLDKVLLVHNDGKVHVGTPTLAGAKVICDFLGPFRGRKVISFKFRRRKNSRRKRGHRQDLFRLRVKEIVTA